MGCKKVVDLAGKRSAEGWNMCALIDRPELYFGSVATVIPRRDGCFDTCNGGDKIEFVSAWCGVVGALVEGCPLGS